MTISLLALLVTLQQTATVDTATTKAALMSADLDLARVSGSARPEALLDRLTPGAPVLFPDAPVYRGAEAAGPYRERYATSGSRLSWTPLHAVVSSDGLLGCTTGTTSVVAPGDTGLPKVGRYVTCWRQDPGAGWRIVAHARNGEANAGVSDTI